MLAEFLIKVLKLFASHVLLNKRRLTGNRPGSARRETGRKKLLPQHPYYQVSNSSTLQFWRYCPDRFSNSRYMARSHHDVAHLHL